jgi:hypothetical protein
MSLTKNSREAFNEYWSKPQYASAVLRSPFDSPALHDTGTNFHPDSPQEIHVA